MLEPYVLKRTSTVLRGEGGGNTADLPDSHNRMKAFFSPIDDRDEKATRLYAVIGRLDKVLPDVIVRISNGGKFLPIDPLLVFDGIAVSFPANWLENVKYRGGHPDIDEGGIDEVIFRQIKNRMSRAGEEE